MGEYGGSYGKITDEVGEYGGSYGKITDEVGESGVLKVRLPMKKVKCVVNEGEDGGWIRSTRTEDDAHVDYPTEGEYEDDINYEVEYSYSFENPQVGREGATEAGYGHRRMRSASGGQRNLLYEDEIGSSNSSEEDEVARVKAKRKTKKSHLAKKHIQEPSLHARSDPGYGESYETPDIASSHSINLVSSWLQNASLGEHLQDTGNPQQSQYGPPAKPPPARRPPPRVDMEACVPPPSSSFLDPRDIHYNDYETYPDDALYSGYECYPDVPDYVENGCEYYPHAHYNENGYEYYPDAHYAGKQIANQDMSLGSLAPDSLYQPNPKPLAQYGTKALEMMKIYSGRVADVSTKAAVGLGRGAMIASRMVGTKAVQCKDYAMPVVRPIVNAMLEEGKLQLMGPDLDRGRGRAMIQRQRPNSAELERMVTPYVQQGRGRAGGRGRAPMLQRPMLLPGTSPGMHRPVMRPAGMPIGQRPVMRPPGMIPSGQPMARRPSIQSGRARGMPRPPQGGVPPMARGQGVAMRGHPRPTGGPPRPPGPSPCCAGGHQLT